MANFTTRVELHNAKWPEDYEQLHKEMAKEGFSRTIASSDGTVYNLPTAEYNRISDKTLDDIFKSATKAATATGKSFWLLITEGTRKWILDPAKK